MWNSVLNSLPENNKDVLIYCESIKHCIGNYWGPTYDPNKWPSINTNGWSLMNVTHWMDLSCFTNWIEVSDETPADNTCVLAVTKDNIKHVCYYWGKNDIYPHKGWSIMGVIKWIPLPDQPN